MIPGHWSEVSYCNMLPGKIHWLCQGPGHVFGGDGVGMIGGGTEVFRGWGGGEKLQADYVGL